MAGLALKRHEDIRNYRSRLAEELHTSILATMGREGMMLCDKRDMTIYRVAPPKVHAHRRNGSRRCRDRRMRARFGIGSGARGSRRIREPRCGDLRHQARHRDRNPERDRRIPPQVNYRI